MSDRADMLGRAAQAWCTADTQDIEMNPALAEAFADILAADMKAERIETVERCIAAVKREERADVEYLAQPVDVVYNTAIENCMRALHKLKEEINEG